MHRRRYRLLCRPHHPREQQRPEATSFARSATRRSPLSPTQSSGSCTTPGRTQIWFYGNIFMYLLTCSRRVSRIARKQGSKIFGGLNRGTKNLEYCLSYLADKLSYILQEKVLAFWDRSSFLDCTFQLLTEHHVVFRMYMYGIQVGKYEEVEKVPQGNFDKVVLRSGHTVEVSSAALSNGTLVLAIAQALRAAQ